MTVQRNRKVKVVAANRAEDVSEVVRKAMEQHPDVNLVLEIAGQARMMDAHVQPIELDCVGDLTVTPTVSQVPGL